MFNIYRKLIKTKNPTYAPPKRTNCFIVCDLDTWSRDLNSDFTLNESLFGVIKSAKNADSGKYIYSGYSIGFDLCPDFLLPDGSKGKNIIIFGVVMSSYVRVDNKKKDVLVLGFSPTQGLDDTTLTAEAQYLINFSRSNRKFFLSLHYNGSNSFVFVNAAKIYQFTAKDSKIKKYPLCLGNISGDFSANNMKKNRIKWMCVRFFCWL